MNNGDVEITVDYNGAVLVLKEDDAFCDLDKEERATATAEMVISNMKDAGKKWAALSDWSLLDEDEFTIYVTRKDVNGVVTRAQW